MLGQKVTKRRDEMGAGMIEGVLVRPTKGVPLHRYRNVTCWSEEIRWNQETVMSPKDRLRKEQPVDTFERLNKCVQKQQPPDGGL